ncbi:uncharacterized protein MYCFIDRAFT_213645 [Pseudocercospora fijiensis CIRAD86]|uniref:Uncharacterized protein n=1 Tax=Pseudocercospora fijiensis (strain CIRAD86) TaxID=383855 RepID=N1Q925_PSEFD|nr:uncharacterized protein MYCFIDRAFT_213645 [Pseudocercospora fijiensis CIRAD86]EME89395.1 hypothetical protein MYCFIDRAFT_213645 [Pseudocercospora fijiensis CIRAD86]
MESMEDLEDDAAVTRAPEQTPVSAVSTSKSRSFSDPPLNSSGSNVAHALAPSPEFKERSRGSRDDHAIPTTPTARRPDILSRGLTLQLPPPRVQTTEAPAFVTPLSLSPKLDAHNIYMQPSGPNHSPATSLPRHSRGLDFSRACTTLHHSTLADQSSPDSSPVIAQKPMAIPGRRLSVSSMVLDSPNLMGPSSVPWNTLGQEKSTVSSSVGSANMILSESESTDSDDDASMGGEDDVMFTTPHVRKLHNPAAPTPFTGPATPGQQTWGSGAHFSPAQASLMKTIRRTRLHKNGKRSRKSSSSASGSGYSSVASPRATSPPPLRSIETAAGNGGYFASVHAARSRRESLAMGTDGLHLSSGNDSGDEAQLTAPSTPGVVRRAVTRRGNLLPKTKGFARIRAALAEEGAPVDSETRREAETMRQVRERDNSVGDLDLSNDRPSTSTAASSPNLLPAVPESAQEDFGRDLDADRGFSLGTNFAQHASRNSGGLDYWNQFDTSMRTPPPPAFARQGSSAMSDVNMDSPMGDFSIWRRPRARSSASDASEAFQPNSSSGAMAAGVNDDMHLKKFKRRREDDFDIATIKRRAVSPGMSAQNSPVLTQSPSARDSNGGWGQPPERKEGRDTPSTSGETGGQSHRSGSNGSTAGTIGTGHLVNHGKKLGLQPMADTNDGLMKMHL